MNDNELLKKRLSELSQRAFERGFCTYSDFLNMDEISTALSIKHHCPYLLFGGYENAERCVIGFGEEIEKESFPICCIKIEPLQQKFADSLSHRDFLGSLMNLGINRNTLGDILIKDNCGYLFCLESISEYITENLTRIKHTSVKSTVASSDFEFPVNESEEKEIVVSSLRADAVISSVYKLSRNETAELFNKELVFVNSRAVTKSSVVLKENDVVSVRHKGRFIFCGELRKTKKDRLVVEIRLFG